LSVDVSTFALFTKPDAALVGLFQLPWVRLLL
jgi:hypothetical protein